MSDGPRTIHKGYVQTNDYLLTNVVWFNDHGPCPETGVRKRMQDGTYGDFTLVQHSCWNFNRVSQIILKGLAKGWDTYRIGNLISGLRYRRCIK